MQPTASLPKAVAQITAISQTILRQLPTGTTPPLIISYTASNVPVIRVGLGGKNLSEQRLNDLALNVVRIQLITIPGASVPYPYGGKMRYVSVDLNYQALQAHGLVPADVINAISAQNLILPSGTAKIGRYEYQAGLNSSPLELSELNSIPIKTLPNGTTLYVRDVANVRSGNIPQTNIVRFNGSRGTMLDVQKTGTASTLNIVRGKRQAAADPTNLAGRSGDFPVGGSIDFRNRGYFRRRSRGHNSGVPHRDHDSGLSGRLEEHADYRHFHSALDSRLDFDFERDWSDDQHHDPWRSRACFGHSCR